MTTAPLTSPPDTPIDDLPHQNTLWIWSIAAEKAPDEDEGYYFKYTLLTCAYFCALHLVIHLLCLRAPGGKYKAMNL
jgi:hypothetical protein